MRNVRLGEKDHVRGHREENIPHQFHHFVSLRQVYTPGPGLLPEEGHRVETHDPRPPRHVPDQQVQKLEQDIRGAPVQIHLVLAEGVPHVADAARRLHLRQQRREPGPHHLAVIRLRITLLEVAVVRGDPVDVITEPAAPARAVVQDQVHHQSVVAGHPLEVVPPPQRLVDLPVIDDRETGVGRGREKGEDVHRVDRPPQAAVAESLEGLQRGLARAPDHVAVRDQDRVLFAPAQVAPVLVHRRSPVARHHPVAPDQHVDPVRQLLGAVPPVEPAEAQFHPVEGAAANQFQFHRLAALA